MKAEENKFLKSETKMVGRENRLKNGLSSADSWFLDFYLCCLIFLFSLKLEACSLLVLAA